jgi:hypothetical protein
VAALTIIPRLGLIQCDPKRTARSWQRAITPLALMAGLCLALTSADAAPPAGSVTRIEGTVTGASGGPPTEIHEGATIFAGEVLRTGANARLEMTLADHTVLTLGADAQLTLDDFIFVPGAATRIDLTINGAFRYVSGKLGIGAIRAAEVRTQFATIGVRGTDFWGGPIDGHFGVVVLEGTVTVTHRGHTVVLSHPKVGTDFAGVASTPGAVHAWARPKIARAIATISFR